jgi:hypothetical protein
VLSPSPQKSLGETLPPKLSRIRPLVRAGLVSPAVSADRVSMMGYRLLGSANFGEPLPSRNLGE